MGHKPGPFYAGVGSRKTPDDVLESMTQLALYLFSRDYWLRSGRAQGADQAFEAGAGLNKEIWTPKHTNISDEAYKLAATIHPAWHNCSDYAKACHARNCYQILGEDLNQAVHFVVCWTPCGAKEEEETTRGTGGTRTAIVLARRVEIPVFNLNNRDTVEDVLEYVDA